MRLRMSASAAVAIAATVKAVSGGRLSGEGRRPRLRHLGLSCRCGVQDLAGRYSSVEMPAISRSSSAWPASMHSFRNTELSTTRTAGLSPDQRPGIVGDQKKVASSSRMDFDAVPPLGLVELPSEPYCPLGFRDESTNTNRSSCSPASVAWSVMEAPEAAAHIGRNCRQGPKKGGRQHSSLKQPQQTSRRRHTS